MATSNYINECKNRANHNRLGKLIVNGINTPITNSDNLQKLEINSGCYINGSIIGSVYIKKLNGEFVALNKNLTDKTVQAQIGVKYSNDSTEYINMGKYIVEKPKTEITANMKQITAYSVISDKLENAYVCNINYAQGNKTLKDLYIDVCNQLGLTPTTTTFDNSNIPITANPFTNKETNKVVLQTIAKIACTWVEINDDTNKIELCWLSTNNNPDYTFEKSDYAEVQGGDVTLGPINCVVIKNSQVDDDNYTRQEGEGDKKIVISEDYILYNQALRAQAMTTIWAKLHNLTYTNVKLTTYYGKPFLKIGSKIRVKTDENTYIDTYVLMHTFTYDGTFTSVIESPVLTDQEIKTKQTTIYDTIKDTQFTINKQEQRINATISSVQSVSNRASALETGLQTTNQNLATTNNNLATTNSNLNALQTQVNGISADFDDFYDNEYIRSISNLQDQIDGAIQFWNGSAIPTLNNYPANQWTTENERINHQADIYTVIQDVQGELKQGKSYRFDKVNNVWQWIELTDNELSAVQAIAQEANNRSKTNATNITLLQQADVNLQMDIDSIEASVATTKEELTNQIDNLEPTAFDTDEQELSLPDSAGKDLIEFRLKGKSEQKSYSGKNLLKIDNGDRTSNGITGSYNDGILSYSGTATATSTTLTNNTNNVLTAGNYTFSIDKPINVRTRLRLTLNDDTTQDVTIRENTTSVQFNLTQDTKSNYIFLFNLTAGTSYSGEIKCMLEKGDTATNFEPYVGAKKSPNPDYPQDIKSIGDVKNLFDKDDIHILDGYLNNTRMYIKTGDYDKIFYIDAKPNTTYTVSRSVLTSSFRVASYDNEIPTPTSTRTGYDCYNEINNNNGTEITITTGENTKYLLVHYGKRGTDTNLEESLATIQIEENSIATDYIPHGNYIDVVNRGKNLFNINSTATINPSRVSVINEKLRISSTGTSFWQNSVWIVKNLSNYAGKTIRMKANLTASSTNKGRYYLGLSNKNGENRTSIASSDTSNKEISFNVPEFTNENTYLIVVLYANTNGTTVENDYVDYENIIITIDNDNLTYEPYTEPIHNYINLTQPLPSLPDGTADELIIKDGKAKIIQKIGRRIFDGNETWSTNTSSTAGGSLFTTTVSDAVLNVSSRTIGNVISNYFIAKSPLQLWTNLENGISNLDTSHSIRIRNTDITSVTDFKTWLSTHNTLVQYPLAEPIEIDLGEVSIKTINGNNYLYITDPIKAEMYASYIRNTNFNDVYYNKSETDSRIKIAKDEINIGVSSTYETKTDSASKLNTAKSYADGVSTTAKTEAINSANVSTDSKLLNYSTTTQMNSAINLKANEITSNVSETYSTKTETATAKSEAISSANASTDTKLQSYSTTSQMNSAINQKASEITSTVSSTYSTKAETTNAVNNIQVGGRNYALGTGTPNVHTNQNKSNDSYSLYDLSIPVSEINAVPSRKLICSFDMTLSGNITGTSGNPSIAIGQKDTPWSRVNVTETRAGTYHKEIVLTNRAWTTAKLGVRADYLDSNTTLTISNLKVEIGNKYTDWAPAPEDIDTKFQNYSTTTQMNSAITQKANEINSVVATKVGKNELVSEINQSAEEIRITGNRFVVDANNFKLSATGTMTAVDGTVGGFTLGADSFTTNLTSEKLEKYYYDDSDLTRIRNIIKGDITPTSADYDKYDFDCSGRITSIDYVIVLKILQGGEDGTATFTLNTKNSEKAISIKRASNGAEIINLGLFGSYIHNLTSSDIDALTVDSGHFRLTNNDNNEIGADLGFGSFNGVTSSYFELKGNNSYDNISMQGNSGEIKCITLTQTSREENKKNFEKFDNALKIIDDIDLYKYNLKAEDDNHKKHIGFVIGKNYKYSSEITAVDSEGKEIGVDNYSMTSLCLQAIKEQQEIIKKLQSEIKDLKERIDNYEKN